ncbi:prenyltransferase/squalene oxidase repeat-containing protein [Streptomyces sp. W16]|uniref:prenyltransferase/squalene oxidase repeat-containing protein n=1 Tax=Streptomyces sp. W16 TaxID=3076631 RepID=UPI00295A8646|nr:prenyltransferase/squalene oxidase repeat-containing protein [Streptomyces sp. W16]MDV9176430.1 prenyltransferase/squalene oxidase repeat-containing protein [Streptomyces sp. W16]
MNVRRSAAALAACITVTVIAAAPAVAGPSPSPSSSVAIPVGLYGTSDPTYDGVWRQSLAMLAQDAVGVEPADKAVAWLAGQQCANGAFAAFRADPGKACDAKVMVDTNSTAVAVQALSTLTVSYDAQVAKAVKWLKSVENADGGWGYSPGGASDANSTAVVMGALGDAGVTVPNIRKDGKSPYDALRKLALPCDDGTDAGAFAYQPDKEGKLVANADATAAAVLGLDGQSLAGSRQDDAEAPTGCAKPDPDVPETALSLNGARWLAKAMAKDEHLTSTLPGAKSQPDYGNTADAIVALSSLGLHDQAAKPLHWLETHAKSWAAQGGPAAYAQLVFVASTAKGADAHDFGGQDLVTLLNATGPAPKDIEELQTAGPEEKAASDDNDGSLKVAWTVGGALLAVAVAVAGFVLVGRGRKRGQRQ